MRKNIPWYLTVRTIVKITLFFLYTKIEVKGKKNIPKNKPVLLVPNHQNSFIDAVLITVNYTSLVYYLTRARAFTPGLMDKTLRSLNMLPVYRVRDGMSSLKKNEAIFQLCLDYLKKGSSILIFPEANHDLKRRVRPLSKGFTRIAFDAEVKNDWNFDMHVLPVGINYSDHRHTRNKISIVYGDAIPVKEYEEKYIENEHQAALDLKNRVSRAMKKLIMHVPNLKHYNAYKVVLDELEPNRDQIADPDLMNTRVEKTKTVINDDIAKKADDLIDLAQKNDLSIRMAAGLIKNKWQIFAFFPIYLFAFLNNILPFLAIHKLIKKAVKDPAFESSIKLLTGMILFPLFYLIVCLILWLIGTPSIYIIGYLLFGIATCVLFKPTKDIFKNRKLKKQLLAFKQESPSDYNYFLALIEEFKQIRNDLLPF